jgi:hypothetical protein
MAPPLVLTEMTGAVMPWLSMLSCMIDGGITGRGGGAVVLGFLWALDFGADGDVGCEGLALDETPDRGAVLDAAGDVVCESPGTNPALDGV